MELAFDLSSNGERSSLAKTQVIETRIWETKIEYPWERRRTSMQILRVELYYGRTLCRNIIGFLPKKILYLCTYIYLPHDARDGGDEITDNPSGKNTGWTKGTN